MPVDGDVVLKAGLDTSDISKKMDSMQKTISRGLKNIIRIGFGVRSVFTLMRKLRKSLFEGFGDLAQVYEPFNSAMSEIMTSLRLLRNSFASAFAPIIESIAPALSTFINKMAEAVSKVGQFIAAMTGKEYVQAGTAYIDYAKSLDKSSKSSSNATKQTKEQTEAQKKLNREITHFDDLVILHEKHEKENTTPTTTTTAPTSTFTTMPVGDAISQFAKDFKAAWAKADFTDIGRQVGERLKAELERIPWEKIQGTIRKIAGSIATFLNGFLETPGLFTEIGTTVGQAINTALAGLSTFAWKFHWGSLGDAVGDAIKAALDTINWDDAFSAAEGFGTGIATYLNHLLETPGLFDSIGTTAGNLINTALTYLNKFAWTFHWDSLGKAAQKAIVSALGTINWNLVHSTVNGFATGLADFLNNLFTEDTFNAVGDTVAELLTTALDFINTFGETFEWEDFGDSLASGLNTFLITFIANDGPAKFDKGVHNFVVGVKNAIIAWLDKVDWYSFGTTLRDIIQNIPWTTLFKSFGEIIWHAIKAVINVAKGIFTGSNTVGKPVIKAFEKLQETIDKIAEEVNFEAIATGFGKVVDALAPAAEGFAVGFINVFTKLFEIGKEFLEALGPALSDIGNAIGGFDSTVIESVGIALGTFVGSFVVWKGLSAVGGIISGAASAIGGMLTTLAAHPLLTLGIGLASVVTGISNLAKSGFFSDADSKAAIENCRKVIEETEEVRTKVSETLDTIEGKDRDIEATYGTIRTLATEYFTLKNKISLTRTEQEKLQGLEQTLSEELPGFQEIISNTTTSYSDQKDAVFDLITQTEQYYRTLAAKEYLQDYYKQMFDLDVAIQKNRTAHDELVASYDSFIDRGDLLGGIIGGIYDLFDGTQQAIHDNDVEYQNLLTSQEELTKGYEAQKTVLEKYGVATQDAGTDTSDFAGSFDAFEGLSIWTPIKMGLISAATKLLGEKSESSDEQVGDLFTTLDNVDTQSPEKAINEVTTALENGGTAANNLDTDISTTMSNITTALENGGTKAGNFGTAMSSAFGSLDDEAKTGVENAVTTIENSGDDIQKQTLETFKNFGLGAANGIEETTSDVTDAATNMIKDSVDAVDKEQKSNSPSKVLKQRGIWFGQGLQLGISSTQTTIVNTVKTIIEKMVSKFDGLKDSLKTIGNNAMTGLYNGISSNSSSLYRLASDIADDIYDSFDNQGWRTLGSNIGVGIYNGLISESADLETLAWNTAVDMYNAACDALDISSPSKKFAWIGQMLMQGWQSGIIDNSDNAVDAVSDVAGAMTDEAENMNPAITISTSIEQWIDALDSVLTNFSETIINRFDNLINTLVGLSNVSVGLPAIAQGKVIPSSITSAAHSSADASEMKNMLESLASQQITYDDLRAMLVEVARDYMQTNFYLGDEQIARHANNGNLLLNRRYSIMK